jgi:hypothetical protein
MIRFYFEGILRWEASSKPGSRHDEIEELRVIEYGNGSLEVDWPSLFTEFPAVLGELDFIEE